MRPHPHPRTRPRKYSPHLHPGTERVAAFTLIELLVAVSLVGLVLAAGATLTYQVTRVRDNVDRLASHHAEADAAVRALTSALQHQYRNPGDDGFVFVGTDDEIDGRPADGVRFFTVSNRVIRPEQPESDVHEVEFYLEEQPGEPWPALVRRTDPTRNAPPDGGGVVELVARRVTALDFEYFDGERWSPDWPEFLNASPSILRVSVAVAIDDESEAFATYRRLIHFPMMPDPDDDDDGASPGGEGNPGENGGAGTPGTAIPGGGAL